MEDSLIMATLLTWLKNNDWHTDVFLTNGICLSGYILDFDNNTLQLSSSKNRSQMIYRHVIASIVPKPPCPHSLFSFIDNCKEHAHA